jgi:hypothetical protein
MALDLDDVAAAAGRAANRVTRRDVARALLSVPAAEALASLPGLRRQLLAAGNPMSRTFWRHTHGVLSSIAAGTASVDDVCRWLEATGSEPTNTIAGGFLWPDEGERGAVAAQLHAQLVAHLEALVAAEEIDPDRLLERDEGALAAYEAAQVAWLYEPLPDGRQPIWAVTDEEVDDFLALWDEAEADAHRILGELLAPLGPRPYPEEELRRACDRIRDGLDRSCWPYRLWPASGGSPPPRPSSDDRQLWLTLAAGVVVCQEEPPGVDAESLAAWFVLDHSAWIGAVVAIARSNPGAAADAHTMARFAATFDFEEEPDPAIAPWTGNDAATSQALDEAGDIDACDVPLLATGFAIVEELWRALGALDEHSRLTPLGWWGLPEALERAWQPDR